MNTEAVVFLRAVSEHDSLVHPDGAACRSAAPAECSALGSHVDLNQRAAFTVNQLSCMAVFDIGVGFDVYTRAKERGIGQTLKLWDKPAQG